MNQPRFRSWAVLCAVSAAIVGCADASKPSIPAAGQAENGQATLADNPQAGTGFNLLAFTPTGSMGNPFTGANLFVKPVSQTFPGHFTTNGRSCASCHITDAGFTLDPKRANALPASDPLISGVMADADPDVVPGSVEEANLKVVMLDQLKKVGLIRIVLPNPNHDATLPELPDNPKFIRTWRSVPTNINAALGPFESFDTSSGGTFKAFTMWDGREISLEHQAGSATMGHAQAKLVGLPTATSDEIRAMLDAKRITNDLAAFQKKQLSLPQSLANLNIRKPTQNHALDGTPFEGAPIFQPETFQLQFLRTANLTTPAQKRGLKVFTGTPNKPACIVCHNMPETLAGGTHLFRSDNIAEENTQDRIEAPSAQARFLAEQMGFTFFTDEETGTPRQTLPLQTIRLKDKNGQYHAVTKADFGLAGQTGKLEDLHQYKISQLRGIKKFNRFFHDNHERSIPEMVQHYQNDFPELFTFTGTQRADLIEFLKAL